MDSKIDINFEDDLAVKVCKGLKDFLLFFCS